MFPYEVWIMLSLGTEWCEPIVSSASWEKEKNPYAVAKCSICRLSGKQMHFTTECVIGAEKSFYLFFLDKKNQIQIYYEYMYIREGCHFQIHWFRSRLCVDKGYSVKHCNIWYISYV